MHCTLSSYPGKIAAISRCIHQLGKTICLGIFLLLLSLACLIFFGIVFPAAIFICGGCWQVLIWSDCFHSASEYNFKAARNKKIQSRWWERPKAGKTMKPKCNLFAFHSAHGITQHFQRFAWLGLVSLATVDWATLLGINRFKVWVTRRFLAAKKIKSESRRHFKKTVKFTF